MDGWRAPDELCWSDTSAGSAPACSMPSSKLNGAQREFTPQYLTGCQLWQSHSHWESFGIGCFFTASCGGSTLDNLHGKKQHHLLDEWKLQDTQTIITSIFGRCWKCPQKWRGNVWFKSPTAVGSPSSVVTPYLGSWEQLNYEASLARTCGHHVKNWWEGRGSRQEPCDSGTWMTTFCTLSLAGPASGLSGEQTQFAGAAEAPGLVLEGSRLWSAEKIGLNKGTGQFTVFLFANCHLLTCSCVKMSSH